VNGVDIREAGIEPVEGAEVHIGGLHGFPAFPPSNGLIWEARSSARLAQLLIALISIRRYRFTTA
jgi:hypothetical protein